MSQHESRMRKGVRWCVRWTALLLIALVCCIVTGSTRSLGIRPVSDCPSQSLSPTEVEAQYTRGVALTDHGMQGEYRQMSSIYEGLPFLKRAAVHGHRKAIDTYGGHYIRQGAIQMSWFDGLMYSDATAEGMMWSILGAHLGDAVQPHDAETYRVLLDPSIPFPDGYFRSSSGTAWMFQMITHSGLDWARQQAYAWRGCWSGGS